MLKISKATGYALLFLTNLMNRPNSVWNVSDASQELGISKRFLANIVHKLARAGLLKTAKGKGGGVEFKKSPEDISVRDIVEIIEGPIYIVECNRPRYRCPRIKNCYTHGLWTKFHRNVLKFLDSVTIKDLGGKNAGNSKD